MEENKNKKTHVTIGSIGHVNYGKTSLIDAINKALKEGDEKQEINKKKSTKRKYNAINDEMVEVDDISVMDI